MQLIVELHAVQVRPIRILTSHEAEDGIRAVVELTEHDASDLAR